MSERTEVSFDAALMMALRTDAQKELDELPTPASCCSGMGKPCVPLSANAKGIYGHASVRGDNRWRRAISLYSGRGS